MGWMRDVHIDYGVDPVSAIGDVRDAQDYIILRQVEDDSGVQSVNIGLDDTKVIWRCQISLMVDIVD